MHCSYVNWGSGKSVDIIPTTPALSKALDQIVGDLPVEGDVLSNVDIATRRASNIFDYYNSSPEQTMENFLTAFDDVGVAQMDDLISGKCANCFVQAGVLHLSLNELGIENQWVGLHYPGASHSVLRFEYEGVAYIADPTWNIVDTWENAMSQYSVLGPQTYNRTNDLYTP